VGSHIENAGLEGVEAGRYPLGAIASRIEPPRHPCLSARLPRSLAGPILERSRHTPRPLVPLSDPRMPDQPPATTVTVLLEQARSGDAAALASVFPLIYDELRRLAQHQLKREPDGHTLSPTALVHEAYMRLIDYNRIEWSGRSHFMAVAATAMRRILVDHARGARSAKRGGAARRVSIDDVELSTEERGELLIAMDDALERLRAVDARQAQVVECRFFGGMTEEETADALGIGLRTAKRDWAKAKSWLHRELAAEHSA
jgi:RNA polymerase sigma factor (TIGR02999 family)